jgi:hypothetical protein
MPRLRPLCRGDGRAGARNVDRTAAATVEDCSQTHSHRPSVPATLKAYGEDQMTYLDPFLDRLAAFEPTTLPVLSLYLNTSSDQHGRDDYASFLAHHHVSERRATPLLQRRSAVCLGRRRWVLRARAARRADGGASPYVAERQRRSPSLAAGALYRWGVLLTPALGAVFMSASTVIVAINARP